MKASSTLHFIATIIIVSMLPHISAAQKPQLGSAVNFVLFSTSGTVSNTATSYIAGNIGTHTGVITGFEPPTILIGTIDSGNVNAANCATDIKTAYDQLCNIAATSTTHTSVFGNGETLFAGVYAIAKEGSVAGDLTLDAQGNSNAVFIFKFGDSFTTSAATTIHLINGALSCNVFWGVQGAITMGAATTMKGTLIANNGAISMDARCELDGRMFSNTGDASVDQSVLIIPTCSILAADMVSFTASCNKKHVVLKWSTAKEINNSYFTAEESKDGINWQLVGTVVAAGNSSTLQNYTITDNQPADKINFYRIKQTDQNGNYTYSKTVTVNKCEEGTTDHAMIYPNPSDGKFKLLFSGNSSEITSIKIANSTGQQIYEAGGFQSQFNLQAAVPGIYIVQILKQSEIIKLKLVINN